MTAGFFDRYKAESRYNEKQVAEYHRHGYWNDLTYRDYLSLHVERRGDQPVVLDDHRKLTWNELYDETRRLAAGLQERGIQEGDRVVFQVSDRAEWFVTRLAVPWTGAVAVTLSPRFRREEIEHIITETTATAYLGMADYGDYNHLDIVRDIAADAPSLDHIIGIGEGLPSDVTPMKRILGADANTLDEDRISPDLPDGLNTTSGTTGLPKLYYAVQNSRLQMGRDTVARFSITPYDDLVVFAPIQLSFGIQMAFDSVVVSGATVRVTDRTDPTVLWNIIREGDPNFIAAVPTQWAKMVNEMPDDIDFSSVQGILHAGSPMPENTESTLEEQGAQTGSIYGASEGGMATAVRLLDPKGVRYNHAGKPALSMEIKVVSGDMACPPGEAGEVIWRGAGLGLGYYSDPERTAEVFDEGGPWEGWFHSGDAGRIDENGNLRIVGRIDNMIIRGGQNVYPPIIEDKLMMHDHVAEVAVVGMPDPEYGERVCAYVVSSGNDTPSLSELITTIEAGGLAKYMWPERLELVNDLPRSSSGKIQRAKLEENIKEKVDANGV